MPYSDSPPSPAQSWAPPKHPLPPHRLARLANALGVSTPMPAIHTPPPMLSPSYNGSTPALDQYRRSPTPSTASTFGFSPVTSKYLLHVIPPIHLPHDSFDSELTPPPSTASGYHTQFRRGTLVPVHSTFQSQLGAIAKEYALPSTAGLILYLVSKPQSGTSPQPSEKSFGDEDEVEEAGPRLSEDIWRHLWTRVVKTELRDEPVSLAPPLLGLSALANRSTPYLAQAHAFPLPLLSTNTGMQPLLTPSPTTPSSTSEIPTRFHTKSAPPSSSSRSDAETPDTSQAASSRADSLDLPGLHSDAIIPILAKVEFDIDRRKAAWYEPWLRSRRLNHAKRKNSMTPSASGDDDERRPPLPFRLGEKRRSSMRDRKRYLPLSESPQSMTESGSEEDEGEEEGKDPLADVFGEDADTWADMRASSASSRSPNPHVVQLALTAAELGDAEDADDSSEREDDDVQDVTLLMNGRPALGLEIPGMQNSPSRKRAPPPTPLLPHVAPPPDEEEAASASATPPDGVDPTRLAYLDGEPTGDIYDDMDLGFEVESDDFDIDDPNDRRKSQIIMRAQLDEIEKNLAQFSPRMLRTELEEMPSFGSSSRVCRPWVVIYDDLSQQAAWPAVPYNSLGERPMPSLPDNTSRPVAVNGVSASMPKRFRPGTGATTGNSSRASSLHSATSSESELRKRDLAEHYPGVGRLLAEEQFELTTYSAVAGSVRAPCVAGAGDSYARWEADVEELLGAPVVIPAPTPPPNQAEVQRKSSNGSSSDPPRSVSTDSMHGGETANRTTLMSVKSIKNLWRKSQKKESISIPHGRMEALRENAYSPLSPPLPTRERPGNPAVPLMTPPPGASANPAGRRRPSMSQERRPSQDVARRASPEGMPMPHRPRICPVWHSLPPSVTGAGAPLPHPARRPSDAQSQMSVQSHQSQMNLQSHQSPMSTYSQSQLSVPPPMLHGPPRPLMNDGLLWDQESPYPTRMMTPSLNRPTSRPPSPTSVHHSSPTPPPQNTSPPLPRNSPHPRTTRRQKERRNSVRKSILKWNLSSSPSQGSPLNLPIEIPPSPRIPDQLSAKMASTSTDSSSSRHHRPGVDGGTHESTSLDTSGFEIVSPKMGGTLSFPYTETDQDGL
ncbi:hypothetical protein B0H12DRAFT_1094907 [Mycena haematopus]|nr:hypothetical protein B0H12DRAFT_1094907 [Mycena haematopus]